MKNKLFPAFALFIGLWLLLTNSMLNPSNPPTGKTGAPGEATCASSDCHTGGTFQGAVSITGVPDTVVPNQTYSITLKNTSNAVKAGFQMTVWDGGNAMCGTFTAGTGVSIGSGTAGKKYARQSTPKTLSGGSTSWTFSWKAPAAASGNKATLYFVSLCANNNGGRTGDNVVQGNKTVVLQTTSAGFEPLAETALKFYPTLIQSGNLNVELLDATEGQITIFDLSGKLMLKERLSASNVLNVSNLPKGIFTAQITAGRKTATKKFVIE